MPGAPLKRTSRTRAELESELAEQRHEFDTAVGRARHRLHERLREDADWWYEVAKELAARGDTRTDQCRVSMVIAVLNKIAPDLKSIGRAGGLHGSGAARVQFNNINLAGNDPATKDRAAG